MESETRLRAILPFVKRVALIEVALLSLLGIVCWAAGWSSPYQYSTVVFWIGVLIFIIGTLGVTGRLGASGDFGYQYGRTAGQESSIERAQQDTADEMHSGRSHAVIFVVGILTAVVGSVIPYMAE